MTDRTPYTYLIGWREHDMWYYGVRWAKGCHPSDLWQSYFTSSQHVSEFRSLHGEPDVIEIRTTFSNKHQAQIWEHKVLKRLNVESNSKFLNKKENCLIDKHSDASGTKWFNNGEISVRRNECPNGFVPGRISFQRKPHSNTHKEKIRIANTGKSVSKETKAIHSKNGRENRWWNNGIISKFCPTCPDGFVPGRLKWKDPKPKRELTRFKEVECPHCGKIGGVNAMKRYHFDKCPSLH